MLYFVVSIKSQVFILELKSLPEGKLIFSSMFLEFLVVRNI